MDSKWILLIFYNFVLLLGLLSTVHPVTGQQQQRFKISPHDLQVLEGSEALLRCEISFLAGQVQWTKDGFGLGFSHVIPGFPRYSVLGDSTQGIYNLRISNASLDDDAEFQCQVGPAKPIKAIRANAKLTVISPPTSIEIQGYTHNSKVEVRENQDLTLTCIVSDAKPAAQIIWFRGHSEYKPDKPDEKVTNSGKRFTTTSTLRLKPKSDDDYTEYSCQAKHKALQPDMPMRATVQLSVLYPPGPPFIEGYTSGETLRRGQTVELVCKSRGGNPPAQLIWYKNGAQVRMAYRTAGRLSENIYTFTAEANDNKARFRCEASNIMSQTPLKTEVDLSVLFAPTHVSISGPSEARVGDPVPLQCLTAPSNPPAEIKWMVGGRQIRNATSRTVVSPEGGWITTSNITAVIEPNKRSLVVICHGLNMQLTENVVSTHTINVLYPPSPPIISGYKEGSIIPAGSVQKLLCISSGGNPLATLTWYKNDKKINSVVKSSDKSVSAELTILANVTDNQARYRCEAHNSATEIPLFETITLSVHFAPEIVKIQVEPEELQPGDEAMLRCDSSSSNPPAKLSWWRDGIPVDGATNNTKSGLWGGTISSSELRINVTQDMNGVVFTCQSSNEELERSVHEVVTLQVLYPPKFTPPPSYTAVGIEGEPLQVAMMATANPATIAYTWTKDGLPILTATANGVERIVSEGPILNITKLNRKDAGIYTCEAVNSQGSAMINITVVVEYGALITNISENIITSPGNATNLTCTVEGKPLSAEHIRWERLGYDMPGKTSTTYVNGTSYLTIKNPQRDDVGNFRCIADNRVSNPTSRDVMLIVKFSPEIDKNLLRAASGTNERARLPCRSQSVPAPNFLWFRNGQRLNVNLTSKYFVEYRQIDTLTYESILLIERVSSSDYGSYECMANNSLGSKTELVRLDVTSPPDPPHNLTIVNVTHESVTLHWVPGFDGGRKASYRIRYREATSEHYKYEDGRPNSNKMTIGGLKMNTIYLFSVMAMNDLGSSRYLPDLTKAQTKDAPPSQPAPSLGVPPTTTLPIVGGTSGLLLLVGVASGTALVLINILLIGCCLHKRSQKRIKRVISVAVEELMTPQVLEKSEIPKVAIIGFAIAGIITLIANVALAAFLIYRKRRKEASTQNSKTATIEMYAPSSYNDTVTGETLSSVSEKSDSYSNEGSQPDYMDETRKKAASTYLVENSDIPPPRYQKDGMLPSHYPNNISLNHPVHTRTLPHPRHITANHDQRARDDQMIGKLGYLPAPSPAPPLDGSYYNMNSDRYLSYPPMDYPPIDFSTPPPLPLQTHNLQTGLPGVNQNGPIIGIGGVVGGGGGGGGGTLRRGTRLVPPPDVTHHTTHNNHQQLNGGGSLIGISPSSTVSSQHQPQLISNNNSTISQMSTQLQSSTPKQPQGILKDPSKLRQNSNNLNNLQILNVQNVIPQGLGNNLIVGGYDPTTTNLSSFNTSMGYTDADGHLV